MRGEVPFNRQVEAVFLAITLVAVGGVLLVLLDTIPQAFLNAPVHLRFGAFVAAYGTLALVFVGMFSQMPTKRV
jgi:hypothetical protein